MVEQSATKIFLANPEAVRDEYVEGFDETLAVASPALPVPLLDALRRSEALLVDTPSTSEWPGSRIACGSGAWTYGRSSSQWMSSRGVFVDQLLASPNPGRSGAMSRVLCDPCSMTRSTRCTLSWPLCHRLHVYIAWGCVH
jgi:hypothetical protein